MTDLIRPAQEMLKEGLCVLPAWLKQKRPALPAWTMYQTHPPTAGELAAMLKKHNADAICIVCGKVSGNLELLDFDCQGEAYEAWAKLVEAEEPGLLAIVVVEQSQSGGWHVITRCSEPIPGNTKIASKIVIAQAEGEVEYKGKSYKARRLPDGRLAILPDLIETRGEGGLFLCAPSPGYQLIQGDFQTIPVITTAQRTILHQCAAALNEYVEPPPQQDDKPETNQAATPPQGSNGELKPWDDYQARGNLTEVLCKHGWKMAGRTQANELWRRPGKKDSWSATFNGTVFYVHSSNADPFKPSTGYNKFQVYAMLEHAGDGRTAARELGKTGFGQRPTKATRTDKTSNEQQPKPEEAEDGEPKTRKKKKPPLPATKDGQVRCYTNDPDSIGAAFVKARHVVEQSLTLRRHNDEWLLWTGKNYVTKTDSDMNATIRKWLGRQQLVHNESIAHPTIHLVNETAAAVQCITNLPAEIEEPTMIVGTGSRPITDPEQVVAFQNGLLDIETGILHQHTPGWFSRNVLDYEYDKQAQCPHWIDFIGEVSETEEDWLDSLQMWFGYNLIADTSQQKLMLFVGPPRSGKGTVCRVLQQVMGKHNFCNPSLSTFSETFGMEPLIGKLAAIVPDAHLGRNADSVRIMECLKSIVGEDHQTIRPIYRQAVNVKLLVRFTISVNELVMFPDASGSMASRTIVLPFRLSHVGNEDTSLGARLATEASGICNWAIEGLHKLKEVRKLLQPAAGMQILDDFSRLSAPIRGFIEDYCVYPTGESTLCTTLRAMWAVWCEENGHEPGSDGKFGERLYAACPLVKRVLKGKRGDRERRYEGIALTQEASTLYMERTYKGNLPYSH